MNGRGARQKGFTFERKIARILGTWWCADSKALWRNTNSGARATVVGGVYGGDIIPVHDIIHTWPFCVEVKKSENWSVEAFLEGNAKNPLLHFMMQCLHSSTRGCNTFPMLICAKNRHEPLCFLHRPAIRALGLGKRVPGTRLIWSQRVHKNIRDKYPHKLSIDFYVLPLCVFLTKFTRDDFYV